MIEVIGKITNRNKCVIFGDFNYGDINWDRYDGPRICSEIIKCIVNC